MRNTAALLVLAFAAAVGTLVAQSSQPKSSTLRIPFESYALANGLRVVLAPNNTSPTVAVTVWYHVGSKNEAKGKTGFAHLFEHVMFTGSGHVPYGEHD
ncbi:MAG TPA: insulinase family protein, partial [Vicinamibacterales bacterium]|nr:insulinase family protein [Vicinamibacterales bacterium]